MGSVWIRWFCDSILGFCDSKLGFCDSKLGFLTRNSVFVTRNSVFFWLETRFLWLETRYSIKRNPRHQQKLPRALCDDHSIPICDSNRFESIRFPKKSDRPIRLYWLLASVCQTTDRRLPQLTRQSRSRHTCRDTRARHQCGHWAVGYPYFARERALHGPQPGRPSLPPPGSRPCVGESNRTNRFSGVNRIESKLFWRFGML